MREQNNFKGFLDLAILITLSDMVTVTKNYKDKYYPLHCILKINRTVSQTYKTEHFKDTNIFKNDNNFSNYSIEVTNNEIMVIRGISKSL